MSLPRIRLENCTFDGKIWKINPEEAHHLLNVRRCNTGSYVEGLLNGIRIRLKLLCYDDALFAEEISREVEPYSTTKLHLILALLKNDQFDEALRFTAEIGVDTVHPLLCERSIPKYGEKKLKEKMTRWNKILEEATKQSGATKIPQLKLPEKMAEFNFDSLPNCRYAALLASERQKISTLDVPSELVVAIGPEGDWSSEERDLLLKENFIAVSLGKRVLRASTAVAVACGVLMLTREEQ